MTKACSCWRLSRNPQSLIIWFITEINICVYASFEIPENQKSGIEHKFGSVVITSCLIGKLSEVGGNLEYRIGVRLGMGVLVFCSRMRASRQSEGWVVVQFFGQETSSRILFVYMINHWLSYSRQLYCILCLQV